MKINIFLLILTVILFYVIMGSRSSFKGNTFYDRFKYKFSEFTNGTRLNVDQIYCIVMPDRKEYMKHKMNQLGVSYKMLDAVTPKDLSADDYNTLTNNNNFYTTVKKTRLPLQMSFTMCYLDAIKNKYDTIIVFEDDITIETNKNNIENSISQFKKSDYAFFYMGYCYLNCNQNFEKSNTLNGVSDYDKLWCAHAICYKVKYLPQLVNFLYPMNEEFDVKLTHFFKNENIKVCIPKHVYFKQDKQLGTLNETYNSDGTIDKNPPTCSL